MRRVRSHLTEIYGVIGYPIKHSLSPPMHNAAFRHLNYDGVYLAFEVKKEDLENALIGAKALGIKGLNVTIPHKERVIEFFRPSKEVEEIGAANTIDLSKERCYNTDVFGIKEALKNAGISPKGFKILILGAGGAARAAVYTLKDDNEIYIANRTRERGIKLAREFGCEFIEFDRIKGEFDLIVNATPVGMKGFSDDPLISADVLKNKPIVFDMVYNPPETKLLKIAKEMGCKTVSGVDMLVFQGAKSFEIWTGLKAPVDVMKKAVLELL